MTTPRLTKIKLLAVFLLIAPLLSGCWDRLEIEDRAVILAIAIDELKPDEGNKAVQNKNESNITHLQQNLPKTRAGMLRVTVQIAVPGRIPLGPGGNVGGQAGGKQKPVWVLSVAGHTIEDALANLQQQMANRLFFGHLRVIVISDTVAKKGIENINDFFRRQPQVRRTAWMVISKGGASKLLATMPQLERVPTLYLQGSMDHAVQMGRLPNDFLGVFWSAASAKGSEGYLPYLSLTGRDSFEISGLALFRGRNMVGTTTALDIGYYMGIRSVNRGGYNFIFSMPGHEGTLMFQETFRDSIIKVDIRDGKPHFTVSVQIEGDLVEKSNNKFTISKENILKLQEILDKNTKQGYERLIKLTQQKQSDIFGFGENVRAKQPSYWNRNIKTKESWQQMYKDVVIDVSTKVNIRRIGTKAR